MQTSNIGKLSQTANMLDSAYYWQIPIADLIIGTKHTFGERLAHLRLLPRRDACQITPSLVDKNTLRVYGRSAQKACRTETVLAVLLSFLL